jgi:predicted TIM-barrel enzyme
MGYDLEVDMIARAVTLDLLTTPYVFNQEDAYKMAHAGADLLVAHVGLTTKGSIGAKTALSLDEAADLVQRIADAGKSVNPEILVICHGGPISEPEDAAYVLSRTKGVAGFFGASSIERMPTESAITSRVEEFKAIRICMSASLQEAACN